MFRSVAKKSLYLKTRRQLVALKVLLAASQRFFYINRELLGKSTLARRVAFSRMVSVRCTQTDRVRGSVAFFQMSRFKVKKLAELGLLPGVKKLSW